MDKLLCVLCGSAYRQPRMCSYCSQIYCATCIGSYLEQHHSCPKCQRVLPEMIDCSRLLNEVKEVKVENTQHVRPKERQYRQCSRHGLPLKYICTQCNVAICSDCGVIEERHRGHKIENRADRLPQIPKGKLRECLLSIEECILKDHTRKQELLLEREVLRSQLRWNRNKLREYYEQMSARLEQEADRLMKELEGQIAERGGRLYKLKKWKDEIGQVLGLKDLSVSELQKLNPSNALFKWLQEEQEEWKVWERMGTLLEQCQENGWVGSNGGKPLVTLRELQPEYVNHTFEMNYHSQGHLPYKYTPPFTIHGNQWRLKIYPKGNQPESPYLSLFLELIEVSYQFKQTPVPPTQPMTYYFRLQLISLTAAGKTISKEYRTLFVANDCWGYHDFIRLDQLQQYFHQGKLIFVVGIRNVSYLDLCQSMRKYIRRLEGQNKVLEEMLDSSHLESGIVDANEQVRASRVLNDSSVIVDSD